MDLQNFIDRLTEIYEDANPETIKPEAKFREIKGYSSLVAYLIIGLANEEFNTNFTAEDLRKSNTINDLFLIIKSKMN
jgi:acyl carrier protein